MEEALRVEEVLDDKRGVSSAMLSSVGTIVSLAGRGTAPPKI